MRGVGHEAAHLIHRALDRRRRLAHEQPSARGDEEQRHGRRATEDDNQRRVAILELNLVGDRYRHHRDATRQRESLGMEPECLIPRRVVLFVGGAVARGALSQRANPLVGALGLDRLSVCIEQVE